MVYGVYRMTEGHGGRDSNDPSHSRRGLVDGDDAEQGAEGTKEGANS